LKNTRRYYILTIFTEELFCF